MIQSILKLKDLNFEKTFKVMGETLHYFTVKNKNLGIYILEREKEEELRICAWNIRSRRPYINFFTTPKDNCVNTINTLVQSKLDSSKVPNSYILAILTIHTLRWHNDFASSLQKQLINTGSLTRKQISFVLGLTSPNGMPTLESQCYRKVPLEEIIYIYCIGYNKNLEKPKSSTLRKNKIVNYKYKSLEPISHESVELIPTQQYSYYKYPFENFNPIQSVVYPYQDEDCNIVISAATSAGKTICAEFFIDKELEKGNKIVYLSPLKSLTQEKYDDWSKRYADKEICIMTGDYVLSNEMKRKAMKADIIVLTSEMLDSRTRNMSIEKNEWIYKAGLCIVDESHIIGTDRGSAVEVGLMRFTDINPTARIVLLSATMPNVYDFKIWLENLNHKKTKIVYMKWRPVELDVSYIGHIKGTYHVKEKDKINKAIEEIQKKPKEKFLVFVHTKATGRKLKDRLEEEGIKCEFHNADLSLKNRLYIEDSFCDRSESSLRVIIATSTLAWGVNLPARNVIIVGVHRGIQEVDVLDIIQMMGRAGRFGIDDKGFVKLIVPENKIKLWKQYIEKQRPIMSNLLGVDALTFHILASIYTNDIRVKNDFNRWYERSFARVQDLNVNKDTIDNIVNSLLEMNMINMDGDVIHLTPLGKIAASLYFSPFDIYDWYKNFNYLFRKKVKLNDSTIAWALSSVSSYTLPYVPSDFEGYLPDVRVTLTKCGLKKSNLSINILHYLGCIASLDNTLHFPSALNPTKRLFQTDSGRICTALSMIDSTVAFWNKQSLWKQLPIRMEFGIPSSMLDLVRVPGIGGRRARSLYEKGFYSVSDIANGNLHLIIDAVKSKKIAETIKKNAIKIYNKEN